jgi:hypothetical protein
MIYHSIWSDTSRIRQHHASNVYTITYGVQPEFVTRLRDRREQRATWLLANKQMLWEGLEQLSQKITWHFGPSIHQSQWKSRNSRWIRPYKARGYQLLIGLDNQGLRMRFRGVRHVLSAGLHPDTRIPQIVDFIERTSVVTTPHVDILRGHVLRDLIDHMLKHGRVDFHL